MVGVRKVVLVATSSVLALGLAVGSAPADVVSRRDPRDTPGRLDIRRISHGHEGHDAVTHTIATYRRFSSRLLDRRGRVQGGLSLILLGEPGEDGWAPAHSVSVRWRNGRLRAVIVHREKGRIGTAKVTRPNRRAVRVTIKLRHLEDLGVPREYFWFGASSFLNRGVCSEACEDEAPNNGSLLHRLPERRPEKLPSEEAG